MSLSINGTSGLVFNDASTQNTAATGFGFKNRIINGAMMIDQRNAGASVGATVSSFGVDRMQAYASVNNRYTAQQNAGSVTPPAGFANYLGFTSSSAYSSAAGDVFCLLHNIEGFNCADLGFGAAGASTVTLSFWVRSSLTGLFGGSLANDGYNRSYPFSYTISSANTWEYKTITIPGDITGTWNKTNSAGIRLYIDIGSGSTYRGTAGSWFGGIVTTVTGATSVVGTNGATFYITGVQLEKGSTATSFDYRPYGTELALCQRYFEKLDNGNGVIRSSTIAFGQYSYKVEKRAAATISISGTSNVYVNNNGDALVTGFSSGKSNTVGFQALFNSSGMTAGYGAYFDLQNGSQSISANSEL